MKKYLIINADDMGFSKQINRGIIKGYTKGIVSDISILSVGSAFNDAISKLNEKNIKDIGIHCCFTGNFTPLTLESFPKNCFTLFAGFVLKKIDKQKIYEEIKAQIKKVKDFGLNITHMDSHEHIHMFDGILDIFQKIKKEENIPFIRYPNEQMHFCRFMLEPINFIRSIALKKMCVLNRNKIKKERKHIFLGHFHSGQLNKKDIEEFLSHLGEGIYEMGTHPGCIDTSISDKDKWRENAQKELEILLDPQLSSKINERGITLISYKELI